MKHDFGNDTFIPIISSEPVFNTILVWKDAKTYIKLEVRKL